MINSLPFQTQARTVDHLGREQIADCPTAISELWKNSYDAYARHASLHIFDGAEPVASLFDDGHGMNYEEFVQRWLVVGTDSKFDKHASSKKDRNGLPLRTKQGQKGIGRLSSANLGPLLLLVSKRRKDKFVAALIDWRIFENPYLLLSDIKLPVTEFENKSELFDLLPQLFDTLMQNVWGDKDDKDRTTRLEAAWKAFDAAALETDQSSTPSEEIAKTIIDAQFDERHIGHWPLWTGDAEHGTALLVSQINYDLRAQLPTFSEDGTIDEIRDRFFATLSAFTDPLIDQTTYEVNAFDPAFSYEVKTWTSTNSKTIIGDDQSFDRAITDSMEHVIEGTIDNNGVFRGQVKAFGEWRATGTDYEVRPPKDFTLPMGPSTFVGPVSFYIATYERVRLNSTHTDDEFARLNEIAGKYSGFRVFRNGLRVLPYGRVDNDFFEIEQRRSVSAGREFWNARRMFGRLAISREKNPNLKDKAGREGFIDNRATKALKTLVVNILRQSAREYFGQESKIRKPALEEITDNNRKQKAEQDRKELARKNRKNFRNRLKKNLPLAAEFTDEVTAYADEVELLGTEDIALAQKQVETFRNNYDALKIAGVPRPLGTAEEDYREYRTSFDRSREQIEELQSRIRDAIDRVKPAKPEELLSQQIQSKAGRISAKLKSWRKDIEAIQKNESGRVSDLIELQNKSLHKKSAPLLEKMRAGQIELSSALETLDRWSLEIEQDIEDTFPGYLAALELLSENIDLELLASQGIHDNDELRDQINRLNQLAQLGITVEILGHEMNSYDQMISSGLKGLKAQANSTAREQIQLGYDGLSRQLEFLSPLKLSGQRNIKDISGQDIFEYLENFFRSILSERSIQLTASKEFLACSLVDQPSRIYPVFINLINNSIYWLVNSKTDQPQILLDLKSEQVVIADNGPGVDSVDQSNLFKMFFSRKVSGGRGIGLYLCRMNLLAGGHSIRYATAKDFDLLPGANFVIQFRGLSLG